MNDWFWIEKAGVWRTLRPISSIDREALRSIFDRQGR